MWIDRLTKKHEFSQALRALERQVLIVRGARQVGKTSFINHVLKTEFNEFSQIRINLSLTQTRKIQEVEYFDRNFFGREPNAKEFFHNLSLTLGKPLEKLKTPVIVFFDEADQFPIALEAIQEIADFSPPTIKVIFTGSNLENIVVKNAATGRKHYFDLYPISFEEFLFAYKKEKELYYLNQIHLSESGAHSDFFHQSLLDLYNLYLRIGGLPKVLDHFLDPQESGAPLSELVTDLVTTIEENVKSVLNEKSLRYEYEDILRTIALSSIDTLRISRLQANHVSRNEAKRLVHKTMGARVIHKIRLLQQEKDQSKYILFDAGVLNYLLNGSDLLRQKIIVQNLAIQYETLTGIEIINRLPSREDLTYWKSERQAEVDFVLKSPKYIAIDVKSTSGDTKSLQSCAIYESELEYIIKVSKDSFQFKPEFEAKVPNQNLSRKISFIQLPHYCVGRLNQIFQ